MTAASSSAGRAISLILLLRIAPILRMVDAIGGDGKHSSTRSRRPQTSTSSSTSSFGEEEPWVAEEVFHGASSSSLPSSSYPSKSRGENIIALREKEKEEGGGGERGGNNRRPSRSSSSPSSSFPGHERFGESSRWDYYDDELENDDDEEEEERFHMTSPSISSREAGKRGRHRLRLWKKLNIGRGRDAPSGGETDDDITATTSSNPTDDGGELATGEYDEEHPMRTDEWRLDIRLSRLYPTGEGDVLFPECDDSVAIDATNAAADGRGATNDHRPTRRKVTVNGKYRKRQVMQFARNGYVRVIYDDGGGKDGGRVVVGGGGRSKPRVGKWRIGHSGVAFDIPVHLMPNGDDGAMSRRRMTVLHYHAEIHLNKFGERPRMFRGVITRDRHSSFLPPNFLRPVIGTFSAEGIGRDTSDTSYKERAISLSRQQAMKEARGFTRFSYALASVLNIDDGMMKGWSPGEITMRITLNTWALYKNSLSEKLVVTR
ncbi:hypothetical protein ACHAXA_008124 [Cyclostephanos tholiformis]|uniref:Uncharacterized protein n=1 Tax=Cyclostephanos tholiformis TaxID=382380 RepID=A0ABD3SEK1_9STRA